VTLVNTPGLIDAGYRDELKVLMLNTDPVTAYHVRRGDRIAQLVVQPVEACRLTELDVLDGDNRGGGFGHTGR
jgi:dUTP pyrophosphatase